MVQRARTGAGALALGCPELAVLSAILHGKGEHAEAVGRAARQAAANLDDTRSNLYTDLVLYAVHAAARVILESLMSHPHEYKSDFARRYYGQGHTEGKAEGKAEGEVVGEARGERKLLLRLLERRFGPLPAWVTARVAEAAPEQVEAWGDHLFDASSLESLLVRAS